MAAITIRNLSDDTKRRLRMRAAEHGRSMEAEAREILSDALAPEAQRVDLSWVEGLIELGREYGGPNGVELILPEDSPPTFEDIDWVPDKAPFSSAIDAQ